MNQIMNEVSEVNSAEQAATLVLAQAMQAVEQGTFAVGGCIIENSTGRVIHAMHNNVLKPLKDNSRIFTYDPTAHGERQLVYWYYQNKDMLNLPEPKDLTVVTTLDPCAMCTGTLLTAGFNVAVVAIDDFAGINYNESFSFEDLPPNLRSLAQSKFGYYACGIEGHDPSMYVRKYIGGKNVVFNTTTVSSQTLMGCGAVFTATADAVRNNSSDSGLAPDQLTNPASLPETSAIKSSYRQIYPGAFKTKIPNTRLPNEALYSLLVETKNSNQTAENAVALLDPFGNVVLCLPDTFDISPVHTAFMNVTQAYAKTRFALMDDSSTVDEASKCLTHPKYGTFVFLYAPNPEDTTTIMTLGAYGSTMEGAVPQAFPANFQYYKAPLDGTMEELSSVIMNLPPFYTQLAQISVMQVAGQIK